MEKFEYKMNTIVPFFLVDPSKCVGGYYFIRSKTVNMRQPTRKQEADDRNSRIQVDSLLVVYNHRIGQRDEARGDDPHHRW